MNEGGTICDDRIGAGGTGGLLVPLSRGKELGQFVSGPGKGKKGGEGEERRHKGGFYYWLVLSVCDEVNSLKKES